MEIGECAARLSYAAWLQAVAADDAGLEWTWNCLACGIGDLRQGPARVDDSSVLEASCQWETRSALPRGLLGRTSCLRLRTISDGTSRRMIRSGLGIGTQPIAPKRGNEQGLRRGRSRHSHRRRHGTSRARRKRPQNHPSDRQRLKSSAEDEPCNYPGRRLLPKYPAQGLAQKVPTASLRRRGCHFLEQLEFTGKQWG